MRIILYTGKGGVGKTSIAAATALKIAEEGKKVMVISTDPAHSLADCLDVKLSSEVSRVTENLDAMEVDIMHESEEAWGNLRGFIKELMTARAHDGIEAEELLVFPGLEELFSLFKILDIYENMDYDTLIVDCAPTGETLALLKFPEVFGNLMEKTLPIKRKMVRAVGPAVEKVAHIPMPKDSVFEDVERLMDKLDRLQELMLDREILSIRIVTTPEKIVIKETKRNFTWLQMFDYNVDAVIVNKVYPREALEGYFNKWVSLQEEGLHELMDSFRDIPLIRVNLLKHELKSIPVLREISTMYGELNPADVLASRRIFTVTQQNGIHRMEIYLPFADKSEMELGQDKGEIHISIKNEKRCFILPDVLRGMEITGASLEDGILAIDFA